MFKAIIGNMATWGKKQQRIMTKDDLEFLRSPTTKTLLLLYTQRI